MKFLLDTNVYFAAIHERDFLKRYGGLLARIAPRTLGQAELIERKLRIIATTAKRQSEHEPSAETSLRVPR